MGIKSECAHLTELYIPEKINNVEAVLSDMEIIVYVTQNTPTTYPNNFTDPDKQMPRVINVCKSALTLK